MPLSLGRRSRGAPPSESDPGLAHFCQPASLSPQGPLEGKAVPEQMADILPRGGVMAKVWAGHGLGPRKGCRSLLPTHCCSLQGRGLANAPEGVGQEDQQLSAHCEQQKWPSWPLPPSDLGLSRRCEASPDFCWRGPSDLIPHVCPVGSCP